MSDIRISKPHVTTTEIERTIEQVPGLVACRVVADYDQSIREIHVIASPRRGAKHIVRDIETLLQARFGLDIDHKRISIAQLAEPGATRQQNLRLRLHGLQVYVRTQALSVEVQLSWGEQLVEGTAKGPASRSNRARLGALATCSAISQLGLSRYTFTVEDVAVIDVRQRQAVVVCVGVLGGQAEETLVGTAYVRGDEPEAAARAVLNALNRRLGKIMAAGDNTCVDGSLEAEDND